MNTRLSLNLICNFPLRKQKGFVMPFVLTLGLVTVLAAVMMIVRVQGDQSKIVSQTAKIIANQAAETGLTRLQSVIAQNPAIAQYNMAEWQTAIAAYQANPSTSDATLAGIVKSVKSQSCTAAAQTDANVKSSLVASVGVMTTSSTTPQSLPNPGSNASFTPHYQLKNYYYYPDGTAKVQLVGLAGANGNAKSNLVTTIPVSGGTVSNPTVSAFPGLWVKQYLRAGLNDNNPGTLDANVAYDCGMNVGTLTPTNITNGSANGYTKYVSSGSSGGGTAVRVALPTGWTAPEASVIPMPDPPSSAPSGVTPVSLGAITGSLTLPRSGDTGHYRSSNNTYYYTASSISGNTVNLQFTPGQKVVVLLTGNIDIGGSSQITHNCGSTANCDATDVPDSN